MRRPVIPSVLLIPSRYSLITLINEAPRYSFRTPYTVPFFLNGAPLVCKPIVPPFRVFPAVRTAGIAGQALDGTTAARLQCAGGPPASTSRVLRSTPSTLRR